MDINSMDNITNNIEQNRASSFTKNLGKSLIFSNEGVMSEVFPNLFKASKDAEEVVSGINFKKASNDLNDKVRKNSNSAKELLKQSIKDIKNGNLYDRDRAEKASNKAMGMDDSDSSFDFSDEDFDFNDFDDEDNNDFDDEDDNSDTSSTNEITNKIKNVTNNNVFSSTKINLKPLNDTISTVATSELTIISQGFSNVAEAIKDESDNETSFFTDTSSKLAIIANSIKNIDSSTAVSNKLGVQNGSTINDVLAGNLSFKDYIKSIRSNAKMNMDSVTMAFSDMIYDPLGYSMKTLMKKGIQKIDSKFTKGMLGKGNDVINQFPQRGMTLVDEALNDKNSKLGKFLSKVQDKSKSYAEDPKSNFLKKTLGEFGQKYLNKDQLNKYLKIDKSGKPKLGAKFSDPSTKVPFDAQTHDTINKVLPGYLTKILSSVTGEEEIFQDYGTGKWLTKSQVHDKFNKDIKKSAFSYDPGNLIDTLKKSMKSKDIKVDDKDLEDTIYKLYKNNIADESSLEKNKNKFDNKDIYDYIKNSYKNSTFDSNTINSNVNQIKNNIDQYLKGNNKNADESLTQFSGNIVNAFGDSNEELTNAISKRLKSNSNNNVSQSANKSNLSDINNPSILDKMSKKMDKYDDMIKILINIENDVKSNNGKNAPFDVNDSPKPEKPNNPNDNNDSHINKSNATIPDKLKEKVNDTKDNIKEKVSSNPIISKIKDKVNGKVNDHPLVKKMSDNISKNGYNINGLKKSAGQALEFLGTAGIGKMGYDKLNTFVPNSNKTNDASNPDSSLNTEKQSEDTQEGIFSRTHVKSKFKDVRDGMKNKFGKPVSFKDPKHVEHENSAAVSSGNTNDEDDSQQDNNSSDDNRSISERMKDAKEKYRGFKQKTKDKIKDIEKKHPKAAKFGKKARNVRDKFNNSKTGKVFNKGKNKAKDLYNKTENFAEKHEKHPFKDVRDSFKNRKNKATDIFKNKSEAIKPSSAKEIKHLKKLTGSLSKKGISLGKTAMAAKSAGHTALSGIKKLGKFGVGKVAGSGLVKGVSKGIEKVGIKGASKGLLKGATKGLLKGIPIVGNIANAGFLASDLMHGNMGDAILDGVGMIPGLNTVSTVAQMLGAGKLLNGVGNVAKNVVTAPFKLGASAIRGVGHAAKGFWNFLTKPNRSSNGQNYGLLGDGSLGNHVNDSGIASAFSRQSKFAGKHKDIKSLKSAAEKALYMSPLGMIASMGKRFTKTLSKSGSNSDILNNPKALTKLGFSLTPFGMLLGDNAMSATANKLKKWFKNIKAAVSNMAKGLKNMSSKVDSSSSSNDSSNSSDVKDGDMGNGDTAQKMWNYFTSAGLSKNGTAGLMGQSWGETRLNYKATNGIGDGGLGLIQMTGNLHNYLMKETGGDWKNLGKQLKAIQKALKDPTYENVWDKLNSASSPTDALHKIFYSVMGWGHRPADPSWSGDQKPETRAKMAEQFYKKYKDSSGSKSKDGDSSSSGSASKSDDTGSGSSSSKGSTSGGQGDTKDNNVDKKVQKMMNWAKSRVGKVSYDQSKRADGKNSSGLDCSSFVYYAMKEGGFGGLPSYPWTTDNEESYKGFKKISWKDVGYGDVFIGGTSGDDAHTGFFISKKKILSAYGGHGVGYEFISGPNDSNTMDASPRFYRISGSSGSSSDSGSSSSFAELDMDAPLSKAYATTSKQDREDMLKRIGDKYDKRYGAERKLNELENQLDNTKSDAKASNTIARIINDQQKAYDNRTKKAQEELNNSSTNPNSIRQQIIDSATNASNINNGSNGSNGNNGSSGNNGSNGNSGNSGNGSGGNVFGNNGSNGNNGINGSSNNGSNGNNGSSGSSSNGKDSNKGATGSKGTPGSNGNSGKNGKNGKDGQDATANRGLSIDEVNTIKGILDNTNNIYDILVKTLDELNKFGSDKDPDVIILQNIKDATKDSNTLSSEQIAILNSILSKLTNNGPIFDIDYSVAQPIYAGM